MSRYLLLVVLLFLCASISNVVLARNFDLEEQAQKLLRETDVDQKSKEKFQNDFASFFKKNEALIKNEMKEAGQNAAIGNALEMMNAVHKRDLTKRWDFSWPKVASSALIIGGTILMATG